MKNIKKILSVLSAAMVISVSGASVVYADEAVTEPTEAITENPSEEETDLEKACAMINDFIAEEEIPDAKAYLGEGDLADVIILYIGGDTYKYTFSNLIYNFMKENNIDKTNVKMVSGLLAFHAWFRDVNGDDEINVRDCAYIASELAKGIELSNKADYNIDENVDVRDVALLAKELA